MIPRAQIQLQIVLLMLSSSLMMMILKNLIPTIQLFCLRNFQIPILNFAKSLGIHFRQNFTLVPRIKILTTLCTRTLNILNLASQPSRRCSRKLPSCKSSILSWLYTELRYSQRHYSNLFLQNGFYSLLKKPQTGPMRESCQTPSFSLPQTSKLLSEVS